MIHCKEYAENIESYKEMQKEWLKSNNVVVGNMLHHYHDAATLYALGFLDTSDFQLYGHDYYFDGFVYVTEINANNIVCQDKYYTRYCVPYNTLSVIDVNTVERPDFKDGKFYKCVEAPVSCKEWEGHIFSMVQGKILAYSLPNKTVLSAGLSFPIDYKFVEVSLNALPRY